MMGTEQSIGGTGASSSRTSLTRPERETLLGSLIAARDLERALSGVGPGAGELTTRDRVVLAATATAAGLEPGDRLVAPHRLIAAHLARGVDPLEVAAARLGIPPDREGGRAGQGAAIGFRGGIGPDAVVALAVGRAVAIARPGAPEGERRAAVALVERAWTESPQYERALSMAADLAVPVVVIVIDCAPEATVDPGAVGCEDFEAVRAAVRAAIAKAHADRGPVVLRCARGATAEHAAASPFRARIEDPIGAYQRWLLLNGFSRADLDSIERRALRELDDALSELGIVPALETR